MVMHPEFIDSNRKAIMSFRLLKAISEVEAKVYGAMIVGKRFDQISATR